MKLDYFDRFSKTSFHWGPSCPVRTDRQIDGRSDGYDELNARHPDVLLKTIKIYKYRPKHNKFIILYHFRAICFDSLESSSGPLMN